MASMLEKEAMLVRLDEEGTYALEGASDALKDDRDVILAAMTTGNEALEYASERLRDDRDVMLAAMAVADDAEVLEFASERLRDDTGFIRALIVMSPATHGSTWFGSEWLRHASERLENDEGMMLLLKLHEEGADAMMEAASDEHKDDKDFLLIAVALDELVLQHASERLKDDKAVVLAAVSKAESQTDDSGSGYALKFASDERQNDKEMVAAALANGWALQDVPEELKNDTDVVIAAVSADENALHYAGDGAKNDPAVLLAAVALYGARKVGHCDKASLDYAHPTLQAVPTLRRVGAIADDTERAAAAADPATVLAVEAEHQAIQARQPKAGTSGGPNLQREDARAMDDDDDFIIDVDSAGRVEPFPGPDGHVLPPNYGFRSFPAALDTSNARRMDALRAEARLSDMCFSNATHWVPAGAAPRSNLEALALSVFELHTQGGVSFNPASSGVEWWVQIRSTPTASGEEGAAGAATAAVGDEGASDDAPASASSPTSTSVSAAKASLADPIVWHWDKDEKLRTSIGLHVFPNVATVTYLGSSGAPTVMVPCRMSTEGNVIDAPADPHVFVSFPREGKHVSFDGRYLHAAPNLVGSVFDGEDRFTFLANVWLNYVPKGINPVRMQPRLPRRKGKGKGAGKVVGKGLEEEGTGKETEGKEGAGEGGQGGQGGKDGAGGAEEAIAAVTAAGLLIGKDAVEVRPTEITGAGATSTGGGNPGSAARGARGTRGAKSALVGSKRYLFGPRGDDFTLSLALSDPLGFIVGTAVPASSSFSSSSSSSSSPSPSSSSSSGSGDGGPGGDGSFLVRLGGSDEGEEAAAGGGGEGGGGLGVGDVGGAGGWYSVVKKGDEPPSFPAMGGAVVGAETAVGAEVGAHDGDGDSSRPAKRAKREDEDS